MEAIVVQINLSYPNCSARTANDILIAFKPPMDGSISLSDVLEMDLEHLDKDQKVANLTKGLEIYLRIETQNIHDMRLPGGHGTSRFPSLDRRRGN